MPHLHDAFAFHLTRIRKALLRASGNKLALDEACELSALAVSLRDDVRRLIEEHKVASDTLAMLANQTQPLPSERRAALLAMANKMRELHGLDPTRLAIDS